MPGDGRRNFEGLQAQSLYCPVCKQAQPVRVKLLLCLPDGDKYALYCQVCGAEVGSKMDSNTPGAPPFSGR